MYRLAVRLHNSPRWLWVVQGTSGNPHDYWTADRPQGATVWRHKAGAVKAAVAFGRMFETRYEQIEAKAAG